MAGASKGLGLAAATAMAREEARVIIMARTEETLSQAAESLSRETGRPVIPVTVDLSRANQTRLAVQTALDAYGRIDILVNNAGGPGTARFLEIDDTNWEAAFRLNLMSAVVMAREVVPGMKARRWGRIINLTSIAVKQPIDGLMLSNAIRAGVHGWAKTLANELAPFDITVNNVLPGYTLTGRIRDLARAIASREGVSPEEIISGMTEAIPIGRLGQPEEVGDLVAFLASEAAGYITGVSIPIDGGFYKGLL